MRIPFGKDATPMVDERESVGQAEFIRAMTRRYYGQ
jgi:hypothetical protein